MQDHGVAPGETSYLGHYQQHLKRIVEGLNDDEKEHYEKMVEEWENEIPDDVARR